MLPLQVDTTGLYTTLGVEKTATDKEIRRAYMSLAKQVCGASTASPACVRICVTRVMRGTRRHEGGNRGAGSAPAVFCWFALSSLPPLAAAAVRVTHAASCGLSLRGQAGSRVSDAVQNV